MTRRLIVLVAPLVALALVPTTAGASYYIDQATAEHYARDHLHNHVGYHYTFATCKPQGLKKADPKYDYHRWVCGFGAGNSRAQASCVGELLITGSGTPDSYYTRVDYRDGRCPYGA